MTKLIITCPIHGDFLQHPANHYLKSTRCPKCSTKKTTDAQRKTKEDFVKEANLVHDNFYTYEDTEYVTARKPVNITCPEHGIFPQLPTNHLKGVGCPSCHGGNFNPSKPTILYYLKVNDGEVYKLGITSKKITARFSPLDISKIEVLQTFEFSSGRIAYDWEQKLLNKYSDHKYVGPPILGSGNTELFTKEVLLQKDILNINKTLTELPEDASIEHIEEVLQTYN